MDEIQAEPIRGDFGIEYLQAIHRHLFQNVYPWAGEIRTVGFSEDGEKSLDPRHVGF